MIKRFFTLLFLIAAVSLQAQDAQMADEFRSNGKIFVVIGVMVIVFLAIAVYMMIIDRKVKKLEEELKNKK